jgi:hypothetical protein
MLNPELLAAVLQRSALDPTKWVRVAAELDLPLHVPESASGRAKIAVLLAPLDPGRRPTVDRAQLLPDPADDAELRAYFDQQQAELDKLFEPQRAEMEAAFAAIEAAQANLPDPLDKPPSRNEGNSI